MKRKTKLTRSSGNVFEDLDVAMPEETLAKAELTAKIAEAISTLGLTQAAAAKILGVDQPKISALLRGRLSGFSTERLIKFLTAFGRDVEIVVRVRPGARRHGHLQVISA
ncbi:MAG: XRE family transcriptional regulator [Deltaproteobacteria bacterium]|nr:XRE family transcriptional regulator [Deltaproteobacteria bacterium]